MTTPPATALAVVCSRLTPAQKTEITARFTRINPSWQGARIADILCALTDADSNLAETEPFFDASPELAARPGAGAAARALIWSGTELTAANVAALTSHP